MIKYMDCIRMEEHITDACMDTFIPPLTLQMLVENALKHNLICEDKELVIEISCTDESIVVKNNIISKPVLLRVGNDVIDRPKENDSYRIGLENIKKRYKYFVNKDVQINRNAYFTVVLPLIKTKVEGKGIL
jgi:sensor histidine kinase YesM